MEIGQALQIDLPPPPRLVVKHLPVYHWFESACTIWVVWKDPPVTLQQKSV